MAADFKSKYDLAQVLGTGAFSEVRLGINKQTGERRAIKIIDKEKCRGKEGMIETEVRILQAIDHPNIVKLFDKFEFDNKIYLIMELVTGGELFDEIVGRGCFPESETANVVDKILDAIKYLHDNGIVHRDLKPENLLLSAKSANPEIKISDFGLSKIFNEVEVMRTACGTPGYVAPEVLRRQGYGPEVDLWSLGVITYILLCGYPPFYDQRNADLFKKIMAGRFQFDHPWWTNISERAKDFVRKLLVVDTRQRITAAQALEHPFIVLNRRIPRSTPLKPKTRREDIGATQEDLTTDSDPISKEIDPGVGGSIETVYSRPSASRTATDRPIILANVHQQVSRIQVTKEKKGFSSKVMKLIHGIKSATISDKQKRS